MGTTSLSPRFQALPSPGPITGIIGPCRAGELMHPLMVQLFGQSCYFVQGEDWGAAIASWMAYKQPDALLGFHINMVSVLAEDVTATTPRRRRI